ncbi:FadR/GntR family transcriptional regulator [Amnibacterium setariae]|uniref:FadR family transcriptional regulator n=1 Tax=Amnibacterium setariae TaxID=2306585 RepID=A0A3A1U8F9_9MICO|nr:FadR/GntR family transcriptional regulator [Amnibacterium setariae]RIX30529.1 FadR family transcriptional regulator [Amnibacterium setariae]
MAGRAAVGGGNAQSQVVVDGIRAMIRGGRIGPGSRIPAEAELATEFGVSRSSLREGVRALCVLGVLETRQGDGTFVTSLDSSVLFAPVGFALDLQSAEHQDDLHLVRRVLEAEAASRAAFRMTNDQIQTAAAILDRIAGVVDEPTDADQEAILDADVEFHHVIALGAGNASLAALIDVLADRTWRARLWLGLRHQDQTRMAHRDHLAILQALRDRDPDRARMMMNYHLTLVEDRVRLDGLTTSR